MRHEVCLTEDLPLHPHLPVMASTLGLEANIALSLEISRFERKTEVKSVIAGVQTQWLCIRRFHHMMVVRDREE